MNKKAQIIFITVVLIPILAPIIYASVNQIIENNREYYCDNENHTLNDQTKECSYTDEILPEITFYCEDSKYRLANKTCVLLEAKAADSEWVTSGEDKVLNYTCPDGFIVNGIPSMCVPLELYNEGYEASVLAKYTETCPDEYEMTQKSYASWVRTDSTIGYDKYLDVIGYAQKKDYINICEKEVVYKAKWK